MVLRDSLGGNCKTKMIATVSAEADDIYESLSTCRFAKRVSKIQNLVSRNEQVDPGIIIQRLKREVAELKAELALARGEQVKESLTSEDIDRCNKMVEEFIDTTDPSKTLVLADRLMINQCFYHFKHLFKDMLKKKGGKGALEFSGPNFGNA
jgi:kinesin family protein 6/9